MGRPEKFRLGEILVQQKLLTEEQLKLALEEQKKSGRRLGRVVIEKGFASEGQISEALARQLNLPYVNLKFYNVKREVALKLPESAARRYRALVLDEPFRELDPIHRERLGTLLRGLAGAGCAVLFADHDVASVLGFADRLFSIETGATRIIPDFRERPVPEWYRGWPAR